MSTAKSSKIIRTALHKGIPNPREMSLDQMELQMSICKCNIMKQQHQLVAANMHSTYL